MSLVCPCRTPRTASRQSALALLLLLAGSVPCAEEVPATPAGGADAKPGQADVDDLQLDDRAGAETKGGTLFRVVPFDDPRQDLSRKLFWRTLPGSVAAQTTPPRLWVDGTAVIEPRLRVGTTAADKAFVYPTAGRMKLDPGDHTLTPGNIKFKMGQKQIESSSPALAGVGDDVLIRCAPVRFESTDEAGAPVPVPLKLRLGTDSLLREDAGFTVLLIWLPVAMKYDSSFGSFSLSADGKLAAGDLAPNVALTPVGLRLTQPRPSAAAQPAAGLDAAGSLWLVPHRARTAFEQG
ncbi:MAG: hypothetical protein NTW87_32640, partial [Planctomycetota bacterium]|nr:hypothetical protein [Planctomycetota bacterium]